MHSSRCCKGCGTTELLWFLSLIAPWVRAVSQHTWTPGFIFFCKALHLIEFISTTDLLVRDEHHGIFSLPFLPSAGPPLCAGGLATLPSHFWLSGAECQGRDYCQDSLKIDWTELRFHHPMCGSRRQCHGICLHLHPGAVTTGKDIARDRGCCIWTPSS